MKLPVGTKCGWTGSNKKGTVIAYFEAKRAYDNGYGSADDVETYAVLELEEGFWGVNEKGEHTPFVTMMIVHEDNLTNEWNDAEGRWSFGKWEDDEH